MAKQPFISHVVNGYSRYDLPESKAFTCTPGILYPVRIDFINARDRVRIAQGIDVRSNPLSVPTFNPYTVRLHRFWVPLQLYHPELRTNSSDFDMNNLSLNFVRTGIQTADLWMERPFSNSLGAWLRWSRPNPIKYSASTGIPVSLSTEQLAGTSWANADTYLSYWDIVRNYYSYSQYPLYSYAWPASWSIDRGLTGNQWNVSPNPGGDAIYFFQRYGDLRYLDYYFESQFYPGAGGSANNTFNRMGLFIQIINSDTANSNDAPDETDVTLTIPITPTVFNGESGKRPFGQLGITSQEGAFTLPDAFTMAHPMAVIPASPDRFSRMLPPGTTGDSVNIGSAFTVPQLAVAARLQEYKDLLGAGGSRFSDWLETFFASKIEHVDRPKLLFSASQTVNAQIVMATANTTAGAPTVQASVLGEQGGSIAFNTRLGREQSYYFREPGYLIDMLSIRPVYYWQNIQPDYLRYQGADYFNPLYNDIGYQDVPLQIFSNLPTGTSTTPTITIYREPCFNEFRASYDEALGDFGSLSSAWASLGKWIQTRGILAIAGNTISQSFSEIPTLFTDISTVNQPFSSTRQDNFFVNLSYSVRKKNLVNKSFATRLANR